MQQRIRFVLLILLVVLGAAAASAQTTGSVADNRGFDPTGVMILKMQACG